MWGIRNIEARPVWIYNGLGGGRYTWQHDQVLKVIVEALKGKLEEINKGKLPKKNEQGGSQIPPRRERAIQTFGREDEGGG